eukprot:750326-Hanusia_phi.AAC.1
MALTRGAGQVLGLPLLLQIDSLLPSLAPAVRLSTPPGPQRAAGEEHQAGAGGEAPAGGGAAAAEEAAGAEEEVIDEEEERRGEERRHSECLGTCACYRWPACGPDGETRVRPRVGRRRRRRDGSWARWRRRRDSSWAGRWRRDSSWARRRSRRVVERSPEGSRAGYSDPPPPPPPPSSSAASYTIAAP